MVTQYDASASGRASTLSLESDFASSDTIQIKNLQLPFGVIAPDVWGKAKEQPALVSINLLLNGGGFGSASDTDKLDDSTIHYGNLAKKVRASCREQQTADELRQNIEQIVCEMAKKEGGRCFIVARSTLEVDLPKASMFGGGVTFVSVTSYDEGGRSVTNSTIFRVRDVKIMTLIGVNAYERSMKQPLMASIELHLRTEADTATLFNLEKLLVQIIQETSFETLETLVEFTYAQLRGQMLDASFPGARLWLRIEKPRAIAFADAPIVEITREVSGKSTTRGNDSDPHRPHAENGNFSSNSLDRLKILRPYMD